VDGHGDLLADDICCLEDGPRILDCLDFDDRPVGTADESGPFGEIVQQAWASSVRTGPTMSGVRPGRSCSPG
jgi:hypothetical protein